MSTDVTNKTILCIFAHPDDESFGPGGTIAQLSSTNNIHILCATCGDAGQNNQDTNDNHEENSALADIRKNEIHSAGKILGANPPITLDYKDGTLSNNMYHQLAEDIKEHILRLKPHILMTFEPRGISGHIDHIAVSFITTYVFNKLQGPMELWYYCLETQAAKNREDYFIYFPPGYKKSEIDLTISILPSNWEKKIQAMLCHKTQIKDAQSNILRQQNLPHEEHFLVVKKRA